MEFLSRASNVELAVIFNSELQNQTNTESGRWQAPAAVLPEGPESAQNTRVRGPEGPEDEQSSVPVLALASATICFSRFGQKSRFSWHNLSTLMTAKMHENFSRVSYLQYKHRVKK